MRRQVVSAPIDVARRRRYFRSRCPKEGSGQFSVGPAHHTTRRADVRVAPLRHAKGKLRFIEALRQLKWAFALLVSHAHICPEFDERAHHLRIDLVVDRVVKGCEPMPVPECRHGCAG